MATQLQPPQPEVVSQEEEVLRAHPVEVPMEPAPAQPKRSAGATMKALPQSLFIAALIVLLVAGTAGWMYLSSYESTDDAQVDGHLHPISARISGTILSVNPDVQDSHFVQAGTVLAEIDPADFQAERDRAQAEYDRLQASSVAAEKDITVISSGSNGRLDLARAAINEAEDSVASERAALQAAEARLAGAEANFTRAEADRQRYEKLLAKHEISQSEYDRVATEASTDHEAVSAGRAETLAAQKRIAQAQSRLAERKADLLSAGSAPQQIASSRAKAAAAISDATRARAQLTTAQLESGLHKNHCAGQRHHRPQNGGSRPARATRPAIADHHSCG